MPYFYKTCLRFLPKRKVSLRFFNWQYIYYIQFVIIKYSLWSFLYLNISDHPPCSFCGCPPLSTLLGLSQEEGLPLNWMRGLLLQPLICTLNQELFIMNGENYLKYERWLPSFNIFFRFLFDFNCVHVTNFVCDVCRIVM